MSHLLFWLQHMTRNIVRSMGDEFDGNWNAYLTLRECQLVFPNNRVALIITQVVDTSHDGPFQASAFEGTFECAQMEDKVESAQGHMMSDDVQGFIDDIARKPMRASPPNVDRRGATLYPAMFHRPDLDGRFLYDDRHNFDPDLIANRVLIPSVRWINLCAEYQSFNEDFPARGAVLALNEWCHRSCEHDFAWTGTGPIWMFKSYHDAFNFRMTWA